MPGMPLRLAGIVKISDKYMLKGSLDFSPILNAVVGDVGVTIASNSDNTLSKSFLIKVLP